MEVPIAEEGTEEGADEGLDLLLLRGYPVGWRPSGDSRPYKEHKHHGYTT
jgi:hypothetical protein